MGIFPNTSTRCMRKENVHRDCYFYLLSVPTMDENIVKTFSLASNVYKLNRSYFTNKQSFHYQSSRRLKHHARGRCFGLWRWKHESVVFGASDDVVDIKYFPSRGNKMWKSPRVSGWMWIFLCAVVFNVNIMLNSSTCLYLSLCE